MYLKTNSYTKLQVSIRKGDRKKSEKPKCNGQTDSQTNDEEIKSPPQVGRGLLVIIKQFFTKIDIQVLTLKNSKTVICIYKLINIRFQT